MKSTTILAIIAAVAVLGCTPEGRKKHAGTAARQLARHAQKCGGTK